MPRKLVKFFSLLLSLLLIFEQSGFAQVAGQIDVSGYFTQLHQGLIQDKFRPLHLRYLSYDNQTNSFKLFLDKGDLKPHELNQPNGLNERTKELLNYFFIGISLPNNAFWVNLRPDSPDNIIDDDLAMTDVGRILLEADLQLKKDTASFTSPAEPEGREYWDKLYKKAGELFGSQNITIPALTRPWIVPNEIIVRESQDNNAYIYKATLKVMLEEDYLRSQVTGHGSQVNLQEYSFKDHRLKELNQYSTQLIQELIIPKLTQELNSSKRYAPLRQVYYSLILAQWFKSRFYGKGGLYSWLIDQKNLTGLISKDPWSRKDYFKAYQKSFQDGEYNLKEPIHGPFGQSIRSYMSGGINLGPEILKAVTKGLVSSSLGARPPSSKNITGQIEIAGGSVKSPFIVGINPYLPGLTPEKIKVLTPTTSIEEKRETSSPLIGMKNNAPQWSQRSFSFPFLRIVKRFVLSIPTLAAIVYNLIDYSLDVFAEALADIYELLSESKLWRFFKIRIFLPLSIRLNIKRGIRFSLEGDRQEIGAGNIKIRFGYNQIIVRKKDETICLVDDSEENNYIALRKNILRMFSSHIKRTKDIENAVYFLYLESGPNIQNFIELAQREGYAELLGEILSLIKELTYSYGVDYVYPEAILKLFPEKGKILSQLKSIKDILPEFRYEMNDARKEIIDPIEYLTMNLKKYPLGDSQFTSLIYTFNPKLSSWDIETAKTIFFGLLQPPSLLLYLLDGSLNKEIRESEGDLNKFVIGVLRKPALKAGIDESFKIKSLAPDLKLMGLKKDLSLAYCAYKALLRMSLLTGSFFVNKVDTILPLDFLAEIKKDEELLSAFMARLNSNPDEFMDNLYHILLIFNPSLLGNIQNIKVIFKGSNKSVFPIEPIINGSLNEIIKESDNLDKFVKKTLKAPRIRTLLKKQILESCLANVPDFSSVLDEIKDNQELINIFIDRVIYNERAFLNNIEVILKVVNPSLLDKIERVKRISSLFKNSPFLIKLILNGSLNNIFEESENNVREFIKLGLKQKMNIGIKNDILRALSSVPMSGSSFPDFYGSIKSLNLNPLSMDFSKLFDYGIHGIEELEPKGRTRRFRVPGDENILHFKHLTQLKGTDELLREISLLEAIKEGIVDTGDIDKNSFPIIVTHPESKKSLFDFNQNVPFADLNNNIEKRGIIYTAPDDYFTYITEDNSRKLHNPENRLRAIAGALENSLDLALSLWRQGIFLDVDIYHREIRFNWLSKYINNEPQRVGTIRISDIMEWFKYPNISVLGSRDFGHYQLWDEIKDAKEAISKIGNYLIYYTFIAAAAFNNNRLKKTTFKDFISRQYKKVGVNVYGGFADEMWQLVENKPVFDRELRTRGLFLKPKTLDAIFEFSISAFLSSLGIEENNALSAGWVKKDVLCLTPDSLITLADGSQKPLLRLKLFSHRVGVMGVEEGDMVLSLNEATGRLEPHRVLALLDMGVKPVYRITTESGKSLKTTLTHPYLTKNGWRKLQDIKVGDEITVVKEDLSSAVSVFSSVNPVNHNAFASHIKTDTILSDSESMGGRRQVNQRPSEGQRVIRRDVKFNLFEDASLELKGKFLKFSFTSGSELDFLNHQGFQINPNLCLILAKGTKPNLLASSIPFFSLNTNLGFIGRWASISSISQPTGLWNTYSLAETCSSSLASTAQSKSHNEYVSKIKYFGEPFLSTTTAALKSEDLMPASLSSLGIGANFASASNLTVSFAGNFIKDVDFMFSPPDNFKYNTLISGLSRLIFSSAFAQDEPSDILWDKIISIDPLGPMQVYDIEVEATHNFIAQGILAHNTYQGNQKPVTRKQEDGWRVRRWKRKKAQNQTLGLCAIAEH